MHSYSFKCFSGDDSLRGGVINNQLMQNDFGIYKTVKIP